MDLLFIDGLITGVEHRVVRPSPAEHPELDEPDGDLSWVRWLEGLQRLETALLLTRR